MQHAGNRNTSKLDDIHLYNHTEQWSNSSIYSRKIQDLLVNVKELEKSHWNKKQKIDIALIFFQRINYEAVDRSITLPGLRIFNGSSACLIVFIVCIPVGPNSSCNKFLFPSPIPCSPVIVPSTRNASLQGEQTSING